MKMVANINPHDWFCSAEMLNLPAEFELAVDGTTRQRGNTADMIFSVEKILEYLDKVYGLADGDVIFTGTPAGTATVTSHARIEARLNGAESLLRLTVA